MVQPVYPSFAKAAGIQGMVVLSVVVDENGRVRDVKVIKSVPGLSESAVVAVRQWVFLPGTREQHAVAALVVVPVVFHMELVEPQIRK